MPRSREEERLLSRRGLLKALSAAPLLLRSSPLRGLSSLMTTAEDHPRLSFASSEARYRPSYPVRSPLDDVFRLVPPGSDTYVTEQFAVEIGLVLDGWSQDFRAGNLSALAASLAPSIRAVALSQAQDTPLRTGSGIDCVRKEYTRPLVTGVAAALREIAAWMTPDTKVETADFEVPSLEPVGSAPVTVRTRVRYSFVAATQNAGREQRTGYWRMDWAREPTQLNTPARWTVLRWEAEPEVRTHARGPGFRDVTRHAFSTEPSYAAQLLLGADDWRTLLDSACGIDIYGNNGVAVGDFDSDGFDDLYISQPAGLPNRLYRNRGDGTFEDVTDRAGVGVLDNTACALFVDLRNRGLQDLLVVCGSGPLLFLNQGDGTFTLKHDAFTFSQPPQGSFTHAAVADYDGDGRLDIYLCVYSYYLGLDQYHYPAPYFDARNGPPNFLMHNEGDGHFVDRTRAAGLAVDNDRYSFACAWGNATSALPPDLYVVNDFGRNTFYRNNGDGTFTVSSTKAHVEDVGAGMSACWSDTDNDGRPDLYVANMWSAAGQRVAQQTQFHQGTPEAVRELYRRHARGNALYRNLGQGAFQNASDQAGVEVGRWAWGSDVWDFDQDGFPDLYVTNGYLTAPQQARVPRASQTDLASFFWRQVVGKSPNDAAPSLAYERGWNALHELIRSDTSWNGSERNVLFANNRDGTFSEVSGAVQMDLLEDGRSFALADLDGDGRLEIIVKNRNAPQLRILHNDLQNLGHALIFRLRGTKSNRDAIGAAVTVTAGGLRQTRSLQAGSGFLMQHTKELHFGLGQTTEAIAAAVRWPSGLVQRFDNLPINHRVLLEEGTPTFTATPFAAMRVESGGAAPEPLPSGQSPAFASQVQTWLLDPLQAPAFRLPDAEGRFHELKAAQGRPCLLCFWGVGQPASLDQLRSLQSQAAPFSARQLSLFSLCLDRGDELDRARAWAQKQRLSFPLLFATDEVAGTYNIIYRYLFDRRRDLPIPVSFLLDARGMIVKVYQGSLPVDALLDDVRTIPTSQAERTRSALPFAGTLYHGAFLRNDFTYGVAMFQHGYLEQAAESFQQVLAVKPDDPEAHYNLGTLYLRRKEFAQARESLQQTLKLKPNYPEAWNNLGMLAAQEGHADEAVQNFQRSLQLRPQYPTALLNLGNVYRRQKHFDQAQQSLSAAVQLQPDDPEANYSLGLLYAQRGQAELAAQYLERAIALRPDYPEARNNFGVLLVHEKKYAEAEQQFQTCIRLVPGFEDSYLNLARLYALQQQTDKAKATVQDLLRVHPDSVTGRQALQAFEATH